MKHPVRFAVAALALAGVAMLGLVAGPAQSSGGPPGPGIYRLRAVGSDWCVGFRAGGGLRLPFLATGDCDKTYASTPATISLASLIGIPITTGGEETLGYSPLAIVPHPAGGFTLRSVPPYNARLGTANAANRMLSCVTIARGVVIGPPGIDVWPCDLAPGALWSTAGGDDQRFMVTSAGAPGDYYIHPFGDRSMCLDVRGASLDINTDLILWECTGQQNQVFHFDRRSGLTTRDDLATAAALTRSVTIEPGPLLVAPAAPARARIEYGIDRPGSDMAGQPTETADDQGNACAQLCTANEACHTWAWVRPGVQGDSAMCWLKDANPELVGNRDVNSGVIRR